MPVKRVKMSEHKEHGHHHHHHQLNLQDMSPEALRRIRWALLLNLSFAIVEIIGGFAVNSFAILSNALHDLGDSLALGLAYFLEKRSHKTSDDSYSYGYRRFSTLAALITGIILICGSMVILIETIPHIIHPETAPKAGGMIVLAILGLAVNGIAALKISKGSSLNEKMLTWHMIEDVMSWGLVLIGGIVLNYWPIAWLDPLLGFIVSLWVIRNVLKNIFETVQVFLQAVPTDINIPKLKEKLLTIEFVRDIHHVHVWSLDGEAHILTAHLSLQTGLSLSQWEQVKLKVKHQLHHEGIAESTLEIEDQSQPCLEPSHGSSKL